MDLSLPQRAPCTRRRQKSDHNGPLSNCSCFVNATSIASSFCDTGLMFILHIHRLKSSDDINKELTVSSNYGLLYMYIQTVVTEFKQIISHTVLNVAWSAYLLGIWGCYGGPAGAPDHMAHIPLRPSPTDALGPDTMSAVTPVPPDGQSSIVDRCWGSLNCFPIDLQSQLVTEPW